MGSNNIYTAGLNNVGSYQVSGIPFATGSVNCSGSTKIDFPHVTRWVIVSNSDAFPARVGFSEVGVETTNYFTLGKASAEGAAEASARLELKLTEIWISGSSDISVVAGLTNLPVERVNNISPDGTNWSGSSGVG
tara:strand:+ start:675 stop:1079 length:405 start_codon:yes stop_codon:yes gene_type:complete